MALWSLDIEKRLGSEFWSNRYILTDLNGGSMEDEGEAIMEIERLVHDDSVTFTRFRVSSLTQGDGVYTIIPVNLPGLRNDAGGLMPLFNTLRVDIRAATGRPSRKFYRGVLTENDVSGSAMTGSFSTLITGLNGKLATATTGVIVDPQGGTLIQATIHPFVQMRQLRRSRRRRTNGGGIFQ